MGCIESTPRGYHGHMHGPQVYGPGTPHGQGMYVEPGMGLAYGGPVTHVHQPMHQPVVIRPRPVVVHRRPIVHHHHRRPMGGATVRITTGRGMGGRRMGGGRRR
mmetsp:Transcript_35078/g.56156  ORF Transcript_35078/g.56156 Transcript_35078/m.56156 type:complete len:104 (+) Transcript_35078:102-413(+)